MKQSAISNELAAVWKSLWPSSDGYGLRPALFDQERGILIIECINQAWLRQARLLAPKMVEKLNNALPAPIIRKVVVCLQEVHVLVTGSRTWDDHQAIADALLNAWHDATQTVSEEVRFIVVHGDCPTGADAIAKQWALDNGLIHQPHPADWSAPCPDDCLPTPHRKTSPKHGDYCPLAGHRRNQLMVDYSADLVLAFHRNNSRGTADCIRRAKKAGIPVLIVEEQHG